MNIRFYNKEINSEDAMLKFISYNYIIAVTIIIYTKYLLGDVLYIPIKNNFSIIFILFFSIFSNFILYKIFKVNFLLSSRENSRVNSRENSRENNVMLLILLYHCFITYKFGLGKAYAHSVKGGTFLLYILPLESLMYIYMIFNEKYNFKFLINILIFISLSIVRGWIGFMLPLFFIFLIYYKNKISKIFLFLLIPIGNIMYILLKFIQSSIRMETFEPHYFLNLLETYFGRIVSISNIVYISWNLTELSKFIGHYSITNEFFQMFIPKGWFINKMSLSTLVPFYKRGYIISGNSWFLGWPSRLLLSFKDNFLEMLLILFCVFLLFKSAEKIDIKFRYVTSIFILLFINGGSFITLGLQSYSVILYILFFKIKYMSKKSINVYKEE